MLRLLLVLLRDTVIVDVAVAVAAVGASISVGIIAASTVAMMTTAMMTSAVLSHDRNDTLDRAHRHGSCCAAIGCEKEPNGCRQRPFVDVDGMVLGMLLQYAQDDIQRMMLHFQMGEYLLKLRLGERLAFGDGLQRPAEVRQRQL